MSTRKNMERGSGVSEKVCLVFTPASELMEDRLEAPLSLLYLATFLKENNVDVQICDLTGGVDTEIPYADFYGFTTYSTTYQRTLQIRKQVLKINPNAKTIAGGPHASGLPHEVVSEFDIVIVGEGEKALLEVVRAEGVQPKRLHRTAGGFLPGPNIIFGSPISNLDTLPHPDYSLVDVDSYKRVVDGKRSFSILSSRGCPYKCLFCNSLIMGGHKPVRFRTPHDVASEIKNLKDTYGDVAFRFSDDIFGLSLSWLRTLTDLIRPLDITYRAFVRANQCTKKEFVTLLHEGGCKHIAIGIESGSDYILKKMRKGQTVKQAKEGIKNAKDAGLIVRIYLIVGFPGETWDTVQETIDFVRDTKPDEFVIYPLIPYPGTPLFHHPEAYGLYNIDKDFTRYFQIYGDKQSHFVYDLKDYNRDELEAMKKDITDELEDMRLSWARDSEGYV